MGQSKHHNVHSKQYKQLFSELKKLPEVTDIKKKQSKRGGVKFQIFTSTLNDKKETCKEIFLVHPSPAGFHPIKHFLIRRNVECREIFDKLNI